MCTSSPCTIVIGRSLSRRTPISAMKETDSVHSLAEAAAAAAVAAASLGNSLGKDEGGVT